MTNRLTLGISLALVVVGLCLSLAPQSRALTFPDRESFSNVSSVSVEILSYDNMSEVSLTPADIKAYVIKNLEKAGVGVTNVMRVVKSKTPQKKLNDESSDEHALLGISLIRTDEPALFGVTKIGSVAVTVHLFQRVTIEHNQRSTHAITWSESRSVSGASKRPKKILAVLDQLLEVFTGDFLAVNSIPK